MADSANKIVQLARSQDRLTTLDYATQIFDDFIEFHGDRNFRDDGAILGGIASLAGRPVTIVGIQKGKGLQDNLDRNFGQPHPEGYRKALRLMKQAENLVGQSSPSLIRQVPFLALVRKNVVKVKRLRAIC
jgi:acetyl-CoA carboxylase carboxyl transferase subunit alpha